ncbi:MAG: DUF4838 domain-containing protein [Kiritimatiellia bacterium]
MFLLPAISLESLAGTFELVGRELTATVVLAENPEASSVLAATELTNYVAKMTGRVLPIICGACDAKTQVKIGTLATLSGIPAETKKALENADSYEAAWSGINDGTLWIVGKEDTSELYATYHFLETKLGVRWFKAAIPDDPGDYYPTSPQLAIAEYAELRAPDFAKRRLDMCGAYWNVIPKPGVTLAIRNGFQAPTNADWTLNPSNSTMREFRAFYEPRQARRLFDVGGGHLMFTAPFPPKATFEEHPEYFALRDGERKQGVMYCFANEELIQRTTDYAIERFRKNGGKGAYLFGQADLTHGWCECPGCRALDGEGENPTGGNPNISTRLGKISKKIAADIWTACPDAELCIWAYHVYRALPKGIRQDPRMLCQFCAHGRCYGHALDNPKCVRNVKMFELLKGWLTVTPQVYTYEYFADTPPLYVCHERDEAHDLKLYKKLGMVGWKNEALFTGSSWVPWAGKETPDVYPSNWQWHYATGHLLWNTERDLDALLDDAELKYYGKAYPPMRQYQALRRDLWNSRTECMGYPYGDARRQNLLNAPGAKEKLLGWLDEADRLADDDKVLKSRLSLDRQWLVKYWIEANDLARAKAGRRLSIPKLVSPIMIDGDGSDAGWLGALYLTDRFHLTSTTPAQRKAVPAELATSVGVATDGSALYFLVNAREPHPEKMKLTAKNHDDDTWGDDGVEIFLFPPSAENCYYHVAVNAAGVVYDTRNPGGDKSAELGVDAKSGRTKDGWTLEIRVPAEKMYPFVDGDKWRIQIARNRYVVDELMPGDEGKDIRMFSLDGEMPHDTGEYPTFELGSSCVKNGSFDEIDEEGKPIGWGVYNGEVRKIGNNNVLFTKSHTFQTFNFGPLAQSPEPRKLKYSFRASGKGQLKVGFTRYSDPTEPGQKRSMPMPWGEGGTYELTPEMKLYSGTYTINPNEWVAMAFTPPREGCHIDDVNVVKED